MKTVMTVAALSVLGLGAGCGGGKAMGSDDSGDSTAAVANEATLTFDSKKIEGAGFALSHVEAVRYTMKTAGQAYPTIIIHLANYDRGGRSYLPNAKVEGQRRVLLTFSGPAGGALAVGRYETKNTMGKGLGFSMGIEAKGANVGLWGAVTGAAELTALTETSISGRVDIADEAGTTVKASFTARIEGS